MVAGSVLPRHEPHETADSRQLKTADGSGQRGEGRGTRPSALCNLPSAVYRLRFAAVLTRLVESDALLANTTAR